MKLVALMLIRDEQWAIGASLRMALRWCDGVFVLMDRCTDDTWSIVRQVVNVTQPGRVWYEKTAPADVWLEMDHRQYSLEMGRKMGGTHFAIVDGDEVLTLNCVDQVRGWFEALRPGELLELPRLAMSDLDHYWDDGSEHAEGGITLGFADRPDLAWKPRGVEQYHFHGRPPENSGPIKLPIGRDKAAGGVMHLQYANRARLTVKHLWYAVNERVRWPNRKTPAELNAIYGAALAIPKRTREMPASWWGEEKKFIDVNEKESWHLAEVREMVAKHGRGILDGLDLRGMEV